jgi:pSer/pThr/pTyr-binding forkhead associated (FHA) protein
MKVITIGRGDDNQIIIEDNQNLVSRHHATLRISDTGRMEIVSTGVNGTFINGFMIKPNVPHKVSRKDIVSFAHVRQLDWSQVPDPFKPVRYAILAVVALVVLIFLFITVRGWFKNSSSQEPEPLLPAAVNDTIPKKEKTEGPAPESKTGKDSTDSVKITLFPKEKKPKGNKKEENKKPETKQKPKSETKDEPQNQVF